ncbi:MAG: UDP-2,3-diacylglucosamine diphosphatase [Burkholderiaceae bacterium]
MSTSPEGIARFDAVFASDIHLSSAHPATTAAFLRFIDAVVARRTGRFFILGDLFEYWAGDDDLDDPLAREIAFRLRELSDEGTAVAFMAGNRDFLIGDAFADVARLTLLPDPYCERIGDVDLLLSHGDVLCTDDVDYQRFRAMVRRADWQRDFLAKPLAERRALIVGARRQSEAAKQEKAAAIMDVNDDAVKLVLAQNPSTQMIHGHTHRPAHHIHAMADGARDRWVLTDWDADAVPPRGGGLALEGGRFVAVTASD